MIDIPALMLLLVSLVVGVLITLAAQWALAIRALTRELSQSARELGVLATALEPTVKRIDRLSAALTDSEQDVHRMQVALHNVSKGTLEFSESFARSSGWVATALPLVLAALEHWSMRDAAAGARAAGHDTESDPVQQPAHTPREQGTGQEARAPRQPGTSADDRGHPPEHPRATAAAS